MVRRERVRDQLGDRAGLRDGAHCSTRRRLAEPRGPTRRAPTPPGASPCRRPARSTRSGQGGRRQGSSGSWRPPRWGTVRRLWGRPRTPARAGGFMSDRPAVTPDRRGDRSRAPPPRGRGPRYPGRSCATSATLCCSTTLSSPSRSGTASRRSAGRRRGRIRSPPGRGGGLRIDRPPAARLDISAARRAGRPRGSARGERLRGRRRWAADRGPRRRAGTIRLVRASRPPRTSRWNG